MEISDELKEKWDELKKLLDDLQQTEDKLNKIYEKTGLGENITVTKEVWDLIQRSHKIRREIEELRQEIDAIFFKEHKVN